MTKRLIITAAVVAATAVSAPAASAAVSNPLGSPQEELGHVSPRVDQGVGTSPGTSSPEATESSSSTPVDEGVSSSPGIEPVSPEGPGVWAEEQEKDKEEDEEEEGSTCDDIAAMGEQNLAAASMFWVLSHRLGGVPALDELGNYYYQITAEADEVSNELGCDSHGETEE
jgi:hypothetical protein